MTKLELSKTELKKWQKYGFSEEDIKSWFKKGLSLKEALSWRSYGFNSFDAHHLKEDYLPYEAYREKLKEFNPNLIKTLTLKNGLFYIKKHIPKIREETECRKILDVPYVKAGDYECSEASFSMMLKYYGINVSIIELKKLNCEYFEVMGKCFPINLNCFFRKNGTIQKIINLIYYNTPIMVRVQSRSDKNELHSFLIVGYDSDQKIFFIHESQHRNGSYLELNFNELIPIWQPTNYSYLYCIPKSSTKEEILSKEFLLKKEDISKFLLTDSEKNSNLSLILIDKLKECFNLTLTHNKNKNDLIVLKALLNQRYIVNVRLDSNLEKNIINKFVR